MERARQFAINRREQSRPGAENRPSIINPDATIARILDI